MASKERSLESTSTWAVALICFILVAISIVIEQIIHHTGSWLKKKKKPALYEALDKIKAELMLVGFISLLLTVSQDKISAICIPTSVGHSWHPCRYRGSTSQYNDPCLAKGKVQLVSGYGVHQLHIFIFVLAVTHVLYSIITYGLGILKMRKWKSWENETKTIQYQYYNDPERFRFARETSFGRRHLHFWSKSPILLWIVCFFRQFYTSVEKVDYLTLRNGFITEHLTPDSHATFNFQKYIKRSLEEDFKVIVGISPLVWFIAVLLLLTNTNGWNSPYWLPFIPLVMLLLVGAKLQVIITKLGMRILDRGDVIKGSIVVQPNDDLFWFSRPRFILFLIHVILFENAFQLGFFFWSWYEYGFPSCYHETVHEMVIQISMGVLVQFLCSYVTLPLYALVTQMGSNMKPTIFSEPVASALRKWHHTAKKHVKQERASASNTPYSSRPASPLHGGMSPLYLLQGQRNNSDYNNNNNNDSVESGTYFASSSPKGYWGGGEGSSASPSHGNRQIVEREDFSRYEREIERDVENPPEVEGTLGVTQHEVDFSFGPKEKLSS